MLKVTNNEFLNVEHVPMTTDYPLDLDNDIIPTHLFVCF